MIEEKNIYFFLLKRANEPVSAPDAATPKKGRESKGLASTHKNLFCELLRVAEKEASCASVYAYSLVLALSNAERA